MVCEGDLMSVDVDKANELLKMKYEDDKKAASERLDLLNKLAVPNYSEKQAINPLPDAYKILAQERLQYLNQTRDEMLVWQELALNLIKRNEALEAKLEAELVSKSEMKDPMFSETSKDIKHTVKPIERIRHASWPSVKNELEKQYAGVANKIITSNSSSEEVPVD